MCDRHWQVTFTRQKSTKNISKMFHYGRIVDTKGAFS